MKIATLVSIVILLVATSSVAQEPSWPRKKSNASGQLIYYPPQVDSWTNHRDLKFRMAFSLTPVGGKSVVGVADVEASTAVSVDHRNAVLSNIAITETYFPSLTSTASANFEELIRTFLPTDSEITISLDRLVASTKKTQPEHTVEVRNDPPIIFISYRPAVLLHFDGSPVLAEIPKTKLQYVVNTNWPVFFDKSHSTYYFFNGNQWMTGTQLQGPWVATQNLPQEITKLPQQPHWAQLKEILPAPAINSTVVVPTVFYTTGPAEVILLRGQPVYSQIPGTRLVYASNTDADLFVYGPTNTYYYLAAGRWFSSSSLQGPWSYATATLPADFSRIPLNNPESRVLVSVPGTEQATDAVLLAQIPTTVTVDPVKSAGQVTVTYYGTPEFKPIEGTALSYATNTADKVIKAGDVYYLCLQGIWFMSPSASGPWTTAPSVPDSIYTIPSSSPVYNLTYVTQTTTDGSIEASYTAGYLGSFIVGAAVGSVIACGTGYYYPPYFGYGAGYPYYLPYAATYGIGSYYNSYTGAYGVARGVYGPYGGATGFASYNPYTGTYARGASVYGPYGSASAGRAFNPYTGTYARGSSVSTPYGTRGAAQSYNAYTGVGAATRQGSSPYAQWGSSVVSRGNQAVQAGHITTPQGTLAGARSTSGAKAIGSSGNYGNAGAVKTAGGDLYAGANGNVYKNTNGSWQKYDNGNWNSINKPSSLNRPSSSSFTRPQVSNDEIEGLNQDFQDRQRGSFQSQNLQNFQRFSGGDGGGGWGSRFGGGGFSGGRFGGGFGGGGGGRFGGRRR